MYLCGARPSQDPQEPLAESLSPLAQGLPGPASVSPLGSRQGHTWTRPRTRHAPARLSLAPSVHPLVRPSTPQGSCLCERGNNNYNIALSALPSPSLSPLPRYCTRIVPPPEPSLAPFCWPGAARQGEGILFLVWVVTRWSHCQSTSLHPTLWNQTTQPLRAVPRRIFAFRQAETETTNNLLQGFLDGFRGLLPPGPDSVATHHTTAAAPQHTRPVPCPKTS